MGRGLTTKQQKFAAFLMGAANGNQTLAARMAGYRGDDRQLAVQGSVNMRNPKIQQMMSERLDAMVEPSLDRFAEGLHAKRRVFVTKGGDIVYSDPEPDHRVRTATAHRVLDLRERLSSCFAPGSDADVIPGHEDGAEPQKEVADDAKSEGCTDHGIDVGQLDPADRVLFEQATAIEVELAEIDRELDDGDSGHGTINKEAQQRRKRLLAARAECVAQMSDNARRAFEQRVCLPLRQPREKRAPAAPAKCAEGHEIGHGTLLTQELRNLIAEAHRLRGMAEQGRDIRTAMKGLDTALKALELYGRASGEIRDQRAANVTVNVVATREEGIQTAAELLLELASTAELVLLIGQLQQRLAELEALRHVPKTALPTAAEEALQPQLLPPPTPEKKEEEEDG